MKKILLTILMVIPLFLAGCSCDKFDFSAYETAVKNYKNSTGFEYQLVITTKIDGDNSYSKEESLNQYELDYDGNVHDFSSELKNYTGELSSGGVEGNPTLISSLYRYYVGEEGNFYTKVSIDGLRDNKKVESITYNEMYSKPNDKYNQNNLVPVFSSEQISNFTISGIKEKKGYSSAKFEAPVPNFIESNKEKIVYKVIIDKDYNLSEIEFVVTSDVAITVNGEKIDSVKTTVYKYTFINQGSSVKVNFPADLASYS